MSTSLQIRLRHTDLTAASETMIRDRAARMQRFFVDVRGSAVAIERLTGAEHAAYWVNVSLQLEDGKVVIGRRQRHEDLLIAIGLAFKVVAQRLRARGRERVGWRGRSRAGWRRRPRAAVSKIPGICR